MLLLLMLTVAVVDRRTVLVMGVVQTGKDLGLGLVMIWHHF